VLLADRGLWSGVQTFTFGAKCMMSQRIALALDIERPGFRVTSEDYRTYDTNGDDPGSVLQHRGFYFLGWDAHAQTGVGVGLEWKL